jgi:hypothetical protein
MLGVGCQDGNGRVIIIKTKLKKGGNNTYLWIYMGINGIILGKNSYLEQNIGLVSIVISKEICDYKTDYYSNNGKLKEDKVSLNITYQEEYMNG